MSNYDFALDMNTDNSNSVILRNIAKNSNVLEFGCAYGRMTKYMKEELNCTASIVEMDDVSGKVAQNYAKSAWIGVEKGNIEKLQWYHDLKGNEEFDYIIFADILEHLTAPEKTLSLASELLKNDGKIFISIPNISYNGVMIDLLQDRFNYRESGILDNTHVKFFTYHSLRKFVSSCNLCIEKEFNLANEVTNSEFNNNYTELPKEISEFLKKRQYGETYQFVWELKKSQMENSIIIPVLNKSNFTLGALKDLQHLDMSKNEIIIVDNGSTDNTETVVKNMQIHMSNLRYIKNDVNVGFGRAVNQGINISQGRNVLVLNNDIRVKANHSDWVSHLTSQLEEDMLVSPTGGFVDPGSSFDFRYEINDNSKPINYLSGWCLAATRKTFDKLTLPNEIGPFDSQTFFVFYEDTDLSFRARQQGMNLKIVPVEVVHFKHVTAKSLNMSQLYQDSRKKFLQKWNKV